MCCQDDGFLNSLRWGDAYMCYRTGSALVQVFAYHLVSTKPLPEPELTHCELNPEEHTSMKFYSKFKSFH